MSNYSIWMFILVIVTCSSFLIGARIENYRWRQSCKDRLPRPFLMDLVATNPVRGIIPSMVLVSFSAFMYVIVYAFVNTFAL